MAAGRFPPRFAAEVTPHCFIARDLDGQELPGKTVWLSFRMMPQGGNWGAPSVIAALAGLVQD
jgi:hypothetical protein